MSLSNGDSPYSGAEAYYARYRPGYGDGAIQHLRQRFLLDDSATVLDLGCGTGQIAIPLSEHVGDVVAMDPNDAMLREGRRIAGAAGRTNIEWRVGSDADLSEELGTFRLITIGRAFHWMDQERTLKRLYRMAEPGGGIAILDDDEWFTQGVHTWQDGVYGIVAEYIDDLPDRTGPIDEYPNPWDELVAKFEFDDVEKHTAEFEREWTIDDVVGYLFTLSYSTPETIGDEKDALESDVRSLLAEDGRERFPQTARVTIISGKKTGDD